MDTGIRRAVLAALVLLLPFRGSIGQDHTEWTKDLSLYEVNVRQYTASGTFAGFETHLDRLQELGVGILWFMPIHPIGQQNRLGTLGSYYSVRDYLDVNPEFGTVDEFRELVADIHNRGMYVIMDWVANHTSWDNALTLSHPDWYSKDGLGNFVPPSGTNWSDVIELDYSKQGLRDFMIDAMLYWVEDIGVDGFRFDAVSFVPHDFWQEATSALKTAKPDILLLAEADGRAWHDDGFDMTFGWGLYGFGGGVLKEVADGTSNAGDLNAYLSTERTTYAVDGSYRLYFTSNHDENSWHGTPTELFGEAAEQFAVLTATIGGMPLIYGGQEAGLDKRLQFFEKDQILWRTDPYAELYTTLLHLKRSNRALWNGSAGGLVRRVLTSDNNDVLVFVREQGDDRILAAFNLSNHPVNVTLSGSTFVGEYVDVQTGAAVGIAVGATLSLPAWAYRVYELSNSDTATEPSDNRTPFALLPNYPNPASSGTEVRFALDRPSVVHASVFDVLGRQVSVLLSGPREAGVHSIHFDTTSLPDGVYLVRLQSGGADATRRLVVQR